MKRSMRLSFLILTIATTVLSFLLVMSESAMGQEQFDQYEGEVPDTAADEGGSSLSGEKSPPPPGQGFFPPSPQRPGRRSSPTNNRSSRIRVTRGDERAPVTSGKRDFKSPGGRLAKKSGFGPEAVFKDMAQSRRLNPNAEQLVSDPKDKIEFTFPEASVEDIAKTISKLTGTRFIFQDKELKGKVISIISPSAITVREATKAFYSALEMNDMAIIPSGAFNKIVRSRKAMKSSLKTYTGKYAPTDDRYITRIIHVKYIPAKQLQSVLRLLTSTTGEFSVYQPTNSIIATDTGANINRLITIVKELDIKGFQENLYIVPVRNTKASEIAELYEKLYEGKSKAKTTSSRLPRSRFGGARSNSSAGGANISKVVPHDLSNSVIVLANKEGLAKFQQFVKKLDFRVLNQDNIHVYYLKHTTAKKLSTTLNALVQAKSKSTRRGRTSSASSSSLFGGDVKITADDGSNSLIINADPMDYETVKKIINQLDKAKAQVFVEAVIMEMRLGVDHNYGISYIAGGAGGFIDKDRADLTALVTNPAGLSGAFLDWQGGDTLDVSTPAGNVSIKSSMGLLQFLQRNTTANILSTPQILAMDNEKAIIEVGDDVPVGTTTSNTASGGQNISVDRKKITIKLEVTPHIGSSDIVWLEIKQDVKGLSNVNVTATALANQAIAISERSAETSVRIRDRGTVILGGLIKDDEQISTSKVPLLGDIPILGWLFKGETKQRVKTNLLIMITPRIIRTFADTQEILAKKLIDRARFIKENFGGEDSKFKYLEGYNLPFSNIKKINK